MDGPLHLDFVNSTSRSRVRATAGRGLPRAAAIVVAAFALAVPIRNVSPDCPADVTGDTTVNIFDLLETLACWGPVTPDCEAADVTGDGTVNIFDLLAILAEWGPCPCVPQCDEAQCGDDGCGGSCGSCPSGQMCQNGMCVEAIGACCYSSTSCFNQTKAVCTNFNGSYQGDGTVCPTPFPWDVCSHSCVEACTGMAPSEACWCDVQCVAQGDCCPDACARCGWCG